VPLTSTASNGRWSFEIGVLATPIAHMGVVAFEN
jgi:hypothetical protein